MSDSDWVPTTSRGASHLSGRAVVGGHEGGGTTDELWVIRSFHNRDMIPGKLRVRHNMAHVSYARKEITVNNIEVLCLPKERVRWVSASNGNVPPRAIIGGHTASGEQLYVARAKYKMALTPGKLHPSHNTCYIPFGGKEVPCANYEVLCLA